MPDPVNTQGQMPTNLPVKQIAFEFANGLILKVPGLPAEVRDSDDTVSVQVRFAPTAPSFIHHDMTSFRFEFAGDLKPGDPVPVPCASVLLAQYNVSLAEFNAVPAAQRPSLATPNLGPANGGGHNQ